MILEEESYNINYDKSTSTVTCKGSLRLSGMEEYAPIVDLLNKVADESPNTVYLNLQGLEFLNSSGINVLSKFVIRIRQHQNITRMVVLGSNEIAWQGKSLKNLQRLMPTLELVWS